MQKQRAKDAEELVAEIDKADHCHCVAASMWLMQHSEFRLSELVFYLRFFANEKIPLGASRLFVVDQDDMAMFATEDDVKNDEATKERLWRRVVENRLAEWTGCGHFAAVMRQNIYLANREDEERATAMGATMIGTTPSQLLHHLTRADRSQSGQGIVIRIEFSTYRAGKRSLAQDFHAFLLDIPSADALVDTDDNGSRPGAYIVQSLWEHYDVSIRPISAADLRRFLRFLALFDGHTPMTSQERASFTVPSFWAVPLPSGLKDRKAPPRTCSRSYLGSSADELLLQLEARQTEVSQDLADDKKRNLVSVLDVFSVAVYDHNKSKERLVESLRCAFCDDDPMLHYGWASEEHSTRRSPNPGRRGWHEVLDAVVRVRQATDELPFDQGSRRILPLIDYLPSPTMRFSTSQNDSKARRGGRHPRCLIC